MDSGDPTSDGAADGAATATGALMTRPQTAARQLGSSEATKRAGPGALSCSAPSVFHAWITSNEGEDRL